MDRRSQKTEDRRQKTSTMIVFKNRRVTKGRTAGKREITVPAKMQEVIVGGSRC
jgi:hypothetical protein